MNDISMLSCFQDELATCINRVLEAEKTKWSRGEEPSKEDGCYVSNEAYDIIQVRAVQLRCKNC